MPHVGHYCLGNRCSPSPYQHLFWMMNGTGLRRRSQNEAGSWRTRHIAAGLENLAHWLCGRLLLYRPVKLDIWLIEIFSKTRDWFCQGPQYSGNFLFRALPSNARMHNNSWSSDPSWVVVLSVRSGFLFFYCQPYMMIPRWRVLFELSMQTKSILTIHAIPDPVCFTVHYFSE